MLDWQHVCQTYAPLQTNQKYREMQLTYVMTTGCSYVIYILIHLNNSNGKPKLTGSTVQCNKKADLLRCENALKSPNAKLLDVGIVLAVLLSKYKAYNHSPLSDKSENSLNMVTAS